jgi:SAM-dependent methyltransferase
MGKNKPNGTARDKGLALHADRHVLYQDSVQCVEAEIDFVDDTYKKLRGSRARILREDFCGTANTACEWVRRRANNQAFGVDLDEEVLAWGETNNIAALGKAANRITLLCDDVTRVKTIPLDVVLAMNFSYWIFKQRTTLRRYFRRVREALASDGLFILDCYGGYEAFKETKERAKYDGFSYIWDQAAYNPITGDMRCHIHFKFPDGSYLKKAFTYDWRLWTLPELAELLAEAGFSRSAVYWQGTGDDGESNGEFTATSVGEADAAWIAYVVAEK